MSPLHIIGIILMLALVTGAFVALVMHVSVKTTDTHLVIQTKNNKKKIDENTASAVRAPSKSEVNGKLEESFLKRSQELAETDTMIYELSSTVASQLNNPYWVDRRNATINSMYNALEKAKASLPDIPAGAKYTKYKDEIAVFLKDMDLLESVVQKALAEHAGKKYKLNPSEAEAWRNAVDLYKKTFVEPSENEYERVSNREAFFATCRRLPFLNLDAVVDVTVDK